MNRILRAAVVLAALAMLAPTVAFGQTTDEWRRQVADRDAEIARLRQRLAEAEGRTGASPVAPPAERAPVVLPPSIAATEPGPSTGDDDRALERALVRQGGLLLREGSFEVEPNFQWSHSSSETNNFRRDAFGPALALRVGLPWQSQFDISVPYVFERRSSNTGSGHADGIGDVSVALSHDLLTESQNVPSLIAAVGYNFSTGHNTQFSNFTSPIGLGAGFDSVSAGITASKRIDPVVYYGGYTFFHTFSGSQGGNSVDLGDSHAFRVGSILAASPFTSLRAGFDLTYFDKTRFNGRALSGTDEPSALFELGAAVLLPPSSLIDVGIGAGLTRSAPDFRITVAYPIRF